MFFLLGHRSNNQFSVASAAGCSPKNEYPIPLDITHEKAYTNISLLKTNQSFFFFQKHCHNCCLRFDSDVSQRNVDTVNLLKEI